MKKEDTLTISDKQQNSMQFADAMKLLVEQKKREHEDLQHKINLAKINLQAQQEAHVRQQSEFNQKLNQERQEFENNKNKKLGELSGLEEKYRNIGMEHDEREIALQERELASAKVSAERKELFNKRIEMEREINSCGIEKEKLLNLQAEANKKLDEAARIKNRSDKELTEAKSLSSNAQGVLDKVKLVDEEIKKQKENLQKIKDEIDPQIEELDKKKKDVDKKLNEINRKEVEVDAKVEEDKKLLQELGEAKNSHRKKEIELASREEDIMRKEIIFKK